MKSNSEIAAIRSEEKYLEVVSEKRMIEQELKVKCDEFEKLEEQQNLIRMSPDSKDHQPSNSAPSIISKSD